MYGKSHSPKILFVKNVNIPDQVVLRSTVDDKIGIIPIPVAALFFLLLLSSQILLGCRPCAISFLCSLLLLGATPEVLSLFFCCIGCRTGHGRCKSLPCLSSSGGTGASSSTGSTQVLIQGGKSSFSVLYQFLSAIIEPLLIFIILRGIIGRFLGTDPGCL